MARLNERQVTAASDARPRRTTSVYDRTPWGGFGLLLLTLLLPIGVQMYLSTELRQQLGEAMYAWKVTAPVMRYFQNNSTSSLDADRQLSPQELLAACKTHRYSSEIISLDPLVIYINDFVSSQEAEEFINIGSPDFAESFISRSRGGTQKVTGRTSDSAPLDESHPLVACLLDRARHFMGSMLLPHEPFSTPQLVRYFPSQKYDLHTDFWPENQVMGDGSNRLFNRVASFFVFLRDNCTDGYTYFPSVEPSHSSRENPATDEQLEKWYGDKVARGERDGDAEGVKFKPIKGNALFWVNIGENGVGDRRLLHAGLPVKEGEKIGLNIWPRKFYGKSEEEDEKKSERKGWSGSWKQ